MVFVYKGDMQKLRIAEQSDIPVLQGNNQLDYAKKGIYVYDSQTQEDMQNLGKILKEKDQLHFVAGCAGFAGILFQLLEIKNHDEGDFRQNERYSQRRYGGRYFLTVSTSIAMLKDQRLLFNAFVQKQYVETLCFSKVPFTVFKGPF